VPSCTEVRRKKPGSLARLLEKMFKSKGTPLLRQSGRRSYTRSWATMPVLGAVVIGMLVCTSISLTETKKANPKLELFGFGGKKKQTKPVVRPADLQMSTAPPAAATQAYAPAPGNGLGALGAGNLPANPAAAFDNPQTRAAFKQMGMSDQVIDSTKKLLEDPDMMKSLQKMSQTFMSPEVGKKMQEIAERDPDIKAMMKDMTVNGPGALSKYMQNPAMAQKWQGMMTEIMGQETVNMLQKSAAKLRESMAGAGGGRSELIKAVMENQVDKLDHILTTAKKEDINAKDSNGYTALCWAIVKKSPPIVEKLLKAGADPQVSVMGGVTVLHMAARTGDFHVIDLLIKYGANVQTRTADGHTAFDLLLRMPEHKPGSASSLLQKLAGDTSTLPLAARFCAIEKVKQLMASTPLDSADAAGMNAVHWAARQCDMPIFNLLASNPDFGSKRMIDSRDKFENTPLHYAAGFGAPDIAERLVDMGSDVNARNQKGNRAFTLAARSPNKELFHDPKFPDLGVKLFAMPDPEGLKTQPKLSKADAKAVLEAALKNDAKSFAVAVNSDPSLLDEVDNEGRTCAHWAAARSNVEILKIIAEKKKELLSTEDKDGNTALHVACFLGTKEAIDFLVTSGADPFKSNKDNSVPYDFAKLRHPSASENEEITRLLTGLRV